MGTPGRHAGDRPGGDRRAWASPALNGAALLAVMALVAVTALVVRPSASPPSLAAFAPEAQHEIQNAPSGQTGPGGPGGSGYCSPGQLCRGPGANGPGAPAPATTLPNAGGPVIDVARVLDCVGNPPRQIEDPQSPPCVAYWKGNNGGATSQGVTATQVTVAWPVVLPVQYPELDAMVAFFNSRFELYGRSIVLAPFGESGGLFAQPTPSQQHADAIKVDQQLHAFASLYYQGTETLGQDGSYYDELARMHVISSDGEECLCSEAQNYDAPGLAGYEWAYEPSLDKLEANLAGWACASLAGQPPVHAGQPYYPGTPLTPPAPRVFGVVQQTYDNVPVDISALLQGLSVCGIHPPVVQADATSASNNDTAEQGELSKLQSEHVSSVICACYEYITSHLQENAEQIGYQPEWLILGTISETRDTNAGGTNPYYEINHTFGLDGDNKSLPISEEPWFWAVKAEDPNASASSYNQASTGDPQLFPKLYHSLLLLASGIQLAGPDLTPANFTRGLMDAQFPNPGAGGPPYYQGTVGFGPGDHTMIQDETAGWYDESQPSNYTGTNGALCYVDSGRRRSLGDWKGLPARDFYPEATPPNVPCD